MKTTVPLALLFAAVIGGGIWLAYSSNATPSAQITSGETATTSPSENSYTAANVAQHSAQSSCWTSINGSVYNLTSFISQHRGGEAAIISLCGKDGTTAFESQHGYSGQANAELATLKIGTLSH